ALALAPFAAGNLAVVAFAGWEGLLAPYRFHAARGLNGESTYDALAYVMRTPFVQDLITGRPWIARGLQIGAALGAVGLRPRNFQSLVDAFLVALLGFITFSEFHSPQFLLWVLPIASFSRAPAMVTSAIALSWLTFLYFPVAFDLRYQPPLLGMEPSRFFRLAVALMTAPRIRVFAVALCQALGGRLRGLSISDGPRR